MVLSARYIENRAIEKLKKGLKGILEYCRGKKPASLVEAESMIALIEVIAAETLKEVCAEKKEGAL